MAPAGPPTNKNLATALHIAQGLNYLCSIRSKLKMIFVIYSQINQNQNFLVYNALTILSFKFWLRTCA